MTQHGQAVLRNLANVQALLEHGKLRTDQINSVLAASQASDATALGDTVVTCLGNLVQSRYVQRARGCNAERPQRPLPATVKVWTPQAVEAPAPASLQISGRGCRDASIRGTFPCSSRHCQRCHNKA